MYRLQTESFFLLQTDERMSAMTLTSTQPCRVVVTEFSEHPEEAIQNALVLEEMPNIDTQTLGEHDVLISVRAASVGWVDVLMICGLYQHVPNPPYCPGLEYSGVIEWMGSQVDSTRFSVGDRVLVDGFTAGPRSSGHYRDYGGFASYAVAPESAVIPLPKHFSFAQGSSFLGNYETAYHCLFACGGLQAGETVLIHGASGSTGLAAVHLAKMIGATVIATGRNPEKLAIVQQQGADHVIQIQPEEGRNTSRFRDEVKEITGGQGVDVVYDGVGGDISLESLRCVKFGARFLIVGWAATPFVAKTKGKRGAPQANMLPTNLIMMKGLKVLGCPTVISTQKDPSIRAERLEKLLSWAEQGYIQPYISHQFPLHAYKDAMLAKWKSQVVGGCVLLLADENESEHF